MVSKYAIRVGLFLAVFGAALVVGGAVVAGEIGGDIPAAVQEAAKQIAGAGASIKYEVESEGGHAVYEVGFKKDGTKQEVELTAAGEVIESEMEISEDGLPEAVRQAIAALSPNTDVDDVSKVQLTFYEVELEVDNVEKEMRFLADGRVLELEDD